MPHTPSRSEKVAIRDLTYHVRHWGPEDAPAVFLLHGWMDASATFQFVVDALAGEWHLIAPDWRGYGGSTWLGRAYWFPDYYADLDALLTHCTPGAPARLVGHSMGASIAGTYAAVRPERVAQLVMMDFLGLPPTTPEDAPDKLVQWLDALAGEPPALRRYPSHAALARRLAQTNPRLTPARAEFLSRHVGRVMDGGEVMMACDPWHRVQAPVRYQTEDVLAGWRRIRAPVLNLLAADGYVLQRFPLGSDALSARLACFDQGRYAVIANCGHNLQHDQPEAVAAALEGFLERA
ncbi:MAG: alpha/beta hydrolase [Rhodocyclaceae bacterium]|nr:alpha/beta hydrolase [Rhodocyclaceae bacterium]